MKKDAILHYQSASRTPVNALALTTKGQWLAMAQDYRKEGNPTLTIFSQKTPDKPQWIVTEEQKANSVPAVYISGTSQLIYLVNAPDTSWQLVVSSIEHPSQQLAAQLPVSQKIPFLFIDNNQIWVIVSNEVMAYNIATLQLTTTYSFSVASGLTVTDGRQLWSADKDGLQVALLTNGKFTPVASGLVLSQLRVSASFIWGVGEFGQGLFGWQKTGQPLPTSNVVNNPEATVTTFAVSPDERRIAFGNASGYVTVVERKTGKQHWGRRLHKGHVSAITFSADGNWLATGGSAGDATIIQLDHD
ncbi:hypothetical protein GCM10028808_27400 [Spirosoma migulaei]